MKRHPKEEIIYGLFDTPKHLEEAYHLLLAAGIKDDDISLLMTEDTHDRDFKMLEKNKAKEGVAAGGILGGTLGGILGGVASLGSVITGIGLVIVGPMIALAAAGGLLGGLIGHGMPKDEAERLQKEIHDGKTMMAVHVHDPHEIKRAKAIFRAADGEELAANA
jgi:outer membrane lipoprotein SlyB